MRLCQDAELGGGEQQFTAQAWNQLDPQLQIHILKGTDENNQPPFFSFLLNRPLFLDPILITLIMALRTRNVTAITTIRQLVTET